MTSFANNDSSIVDMILCLDECEVPVKVLNLAIAPRMWSIDDLHCIVAIDRVLLSVQGRSLGIVWDSRQSLWFHLLDFAMHRKHVKEITFEPHNDSDSLRVDAD